jgi:hypothetical protein
VRDRFSLNPIRWIAEKFIITPHYRFGANDVSPAIPHANRAEVDTRA